MNVLLVLLVYGVFCVGLLYVVFGGFLYGAMYMKLPRKRVQRMLELGKVDKTKVVYDLGAGFGNIAFQAAEVAGAVVAVEADPFKSFWVGQQIKNKGVQNMTSVRGNLLDVNLEGDVLLCYLGDGLMDRLAEKTLKHNALIVSCCHKIQNWKPIFTDPHKVYPIYVYQVP